MKKVLIIIAIIIVVVIGFRFCSRGLRKAQVELPKPVRTADAVLGEISVVLHEIGEIQPIREIDIKARISGKVIKLYVDEGDYIEQGDLIADVEPDFNQASQIANIRNNLHITQLRLENAEKDYQRKKTLFDNNFISKEEVDRAVDDLEIAKINYQSALQQFELIREIDTEGNISKIFSTASGTVIKKGVEEGEMVTSSTSSFSDGTVILKIADLREMVVNSHINEVDISKVHINQQAKMQVDAFPYHEYSGLITRIGTQAITRNNVKVFPIVIQITERDTPLRPGMTANVTIYGESKKEIVVIPIRAVFVDEDGRDIVYKVVNDSLATAGTPIRTGINDFSTVEIIEGVLEGEKVSLVEP